MACKTSFELHHNFPKIAEESGFTFNTHKSRVHINWNKIKLIDIDNLIRDRTFNLIELHINDILDCVLESEFDVKILDEGVLKMFRLAQLAVEYQQFCRHYLDRCVFVLREEVTNLVQDLDATKRNLKEKEEENRKLKKKSKHIIRTPLPYGNENIATMILRTLNQNKGELFAPTSQLDTMQYNKCSYCEKVFLNQLYLNSHISRRHANVLEVPQKDKTDDEITNGTNSKLANEVDELKTKLKQMEDLIANTYNPNNPTTTSAVSQIDTTKSEEKTFDINNRKEMKDVEVSTNEEESILDKIQAWKKEESEKYNEELSSLKKQIIEIINNKDKIDNTSIQSELKMMKQLNNTINEQGGEILALKQELFKAESDEVEKRKKMEEQMAFWIKRAEMQSNEYKLLLQKLNDVAIEAQECQMQANTEKERAKQLEELLKQHLHKTSPKHRPITSKQNVTRYCKEPKSKEELQATKDMQIRPTADVITLRKLQQKAQELLNIGQTSTSDCSSASEVKAKVDVLKKERQSEDSVKKKKKREKMRHEQDVIKPKPRNTLVTSEKTEHNNNKHKEQKRPTKRNSAALVKGNGYVYVPGSPLKIVRAKITEEVNQRLISLGVDPLNSRLTKNAFQKQRKLLQEQQEFKSKKMPSREKIMHSIMCNLNQNTSSVNKIHQVDYISPSKSRKTFSLSSVLSNVKTKALSLVKPQEAINKPNKSYDDVAKKAIALLKTPPGSAYSSPTLPRRTVVINSPERNFHVLKTNDKYQSTKIRTKNSPKKTHKTKECSNGNCSESDEQVNNQQSTKFRTDLAMSSTHCVDNDKPHIANQKEFLLENGCKPEAINVITKTIFENSDNVSDDVDSLIDISPRKFLSEENLSTNPKETKGVLKNASSTSSLNKKKVLFDMDAIQMKSVSASPSQSITEKSDNNEKYTLGSVNVDIEDWDISSIENEPVKTINTKTRISSHTSPKIAELKQTIESQLTRRNPTLGTSLVGGVDTLAVPMQKASHGGSNTSLGSSILDDIGSDPILHHKTVITPRTAFEKEESEIEISDLMDDSIVNKKY